MSQIASSPITQVAPPMQTPQMQPEQAFPTRLSLELRGTRFEIDREMLMSLPESILIVMFPNGLIIGRGVDPYGEEVSEADTSSEDSDGLEDQLIYVDFDPACLTFILEFYQKAQEAFYSNHQGGASAYPPSAQNPLLNKQAIIVLREELDYFTIPPKSKKVVVDVASYIKDNSDVESVIDLYTLKSECGVHLLNQKKIFTALQRNVNKENNAAEQHLIDMLCVSGFSRDDEWGYRNIEPQRTSIVSIALVMLKTTGQSNQMATAQKLLLFWRKPARKCWWDGVEVSIGEEDNPTKVRLWCRRTWTLELALV